MPARLVPLPELSTKDLEAWRDLSGRSAVANPYFDPDFVLPAARGLGCFDEVAAVVVERGGEWVASQPVLRRGQWRRLPLPCLTTFLHPYCLLGTPLLADDEAGGVAEIAVEMCSVKGRAFAALEWLAAEGPSADDVEEVGSAAIPVETFSRATLLRRRRNDYLDGRLKGKHRREFRRLAKGLEGELGGELQLIDRAGQPDAIERFLALESAGWKGRKGTALASDSGHAEFFRTAMANLSERGMLELYFLEADGQVAAARCSLLAGGGSFCFKIAYDEELSRFSPGRELELRLIDRFHDDGRLQWMDSCAAPDNGLFNRLWPDRRRLRTVAYRSRGPLGALGPPAVRSLAAALRGRRRESIRP